MKLSIRELDSIHTEVTSLDKEVICYDGEISMLFVKFFYPKKSRRNKYVSKQKGIIRFRELMADVLGYYEL